jgi:trehalose/maltose hydrolase-like predicted phosphorylase
MMMDIAEVQDLALTRDSTWLIAWEGFDPLRERDVESLMTVGNGYLGTRGSIEEGDVASRPSTLIAGVFNALPETGNRPELVVAPDWLEVKVWVEGELLSCRTGEVIEHRRTLDMRRGILVRAWRHRDKHGRITRLVYVRFASLADRHIVGLRVEVTPENYAGHIRIQSGINGDSTDRDAQSNRSRHLEPLYSQECGQALLLAMRTRSVRSSAASNQAPGADLAPHRSRSPITIVMAARHSIISQHTAKPFAFERRVEASQRHVYEILEWDAQLGCYYRLDKLVSVWTSRDIEHNKQHVRTLAQTDGGNWSSCNAEELVERATTHLKEACRCGFDLLLEESVRSWAERWRDAEMAIEGHSEDERAIRFSMYHLIIAGNPEDDRVSISARTLSGPSYGGHVFWDTEIFMLPFFIFTHPPTARALLMYRYRTLSAAREKARAFGYRGAMYAWESADTGEEATPEEVVLPTGARVKVLSGFEEHHITADVPYAIWQYWCATGDDQFMCEAGVEIIIECARFWESRVEEGEDKRFHIRRVIGPDEYHENIDDNAFTNVMAAWALERACAASEWMRKNYPDAWEKLKRRIQVSETECARWSDVAARMFIGFDESTGLIEQFAGFFKLQEINLAEYEPRTAPMDIILGRSRTQASQVIKQADVLMLFHLLMDRYSRDVVEKNFRYYEPRTGHGSSLSPSTHALIAARLGLMPEAMRFFHQAASIDLGNSMGNASGGVHAAACGGLWQAVVFGFAGMKLSEGGLSFDPHLPEEWKRLSFAIVYRGNHLCVSMASSPLSVRVWLREGAGSLAIRIGALHTSIQPGASLEAVCVDGIWRVE